MSSDSSSDSSVILRLSDVGKFYPANTSPMTMIRYLMPRRVRARPTDVWALRNISFDLERGKVLGIIGRNGSGKSTLLQLVAGLLKPSEGRIEVRGSTAALIELGAGFNPEFTGRENVMMNGSIHGFSQAEMEEKLEEIVDFAELHPFIDRRVKTYSSGMFARLAFSVAIHVDPDVLLVDEILSVGDIEFQAKCFRRIEELRDAGVSILFVSHNLSSMQTLADDAVLLDKGGVAFCGSPKGAIDEYLHRLGDQVKPSGRSTEAETDACQYRAEIRDAEFFNAKGRPTKHPRTGERCQVRYRVCFGDRVEHPVVTLQIRTMLGLPVYELTNLSARRPLSAFSKGQELCVVFDLTMNLCPGSFRVGVGVADMQRGMPVPLYGLESLVVEVMSEGCGDGVAFLDGDIHFDESDAAETIRERS